MSIFYPKSIYDRMDTNSSNSIIAITESTHLIKNINEYKFPFKFTCNNDNRVYYNAYFIKSEIIYSNQYSQKINSIQYKYNIDINDCIKLARDFKNITKEDIDNISNQLLILCLNEINKKRLNNDNILFNITINETS